MGCNPLVAPSSFPVPDPSYHSRSSGETVLAQRGNAVAVFKRGSRAAAAKGSWRRASFKTVKTKEHWTLWASSGAANSAQLRADLKRRVESIVLTEDGLVPLDLTDPSAREALLGPAGASYGNKGVVVGSDGSLRKDGAMGAAYAAKEKRVPARSVAVNGSRSSCRPELTVIAMACKDVRREEDLTILTDSLSCMVRLKNLQRRDFPLWFYRHPLRQLLVHTVRLILNARAESGSVTRFIKVKSHRGEPLNEAADTLAAAAAELNPSRLSGSQVESLEWGPQLRN